MGNEEGETEEGANEDSSGRHGIDRVSKYTEHISTANRVCVCHNHTPARMLQLTCEFEMLGNNVYNIFNSLSYTKIHTVQ